MFISGTSTVLVTLEDIAEISRQRIQMAQMNVADGLALVARGL